MTRKKWLAPALAIAAAALIYFSAANLIPPAHADPRQEITRLAELMQWHPGTIVADIGAGDGEYTFEAAEKVGPSGRVFATEIDQDKLKSLRTEVAARKLSNVTVVESAADDTRLPANCCDAIFLRHVYHHITQPQAFDKNLLRSLKPGARLAIIDFPPDKSLPPVEGIPKNRGGHGIPQKIMVDELTAAGLQLEKVVKDWSARDYCVIFQRPNL
ncbi:MAG: class I SAM-dependent methyltransferase [Candidatus Acidiferrales bacterium]